MGTARKDRQTIRLNKTEIEAMESGPKDYFKPVEGFQGLHVRVLPNGEKSFVLRFRLEGIQRKYSLGRYPAMTPDAARKAHTAAWMKINEGKDPGQVKADARAAAKAQRAAVTVADLANRYIHEHLPGNGAGWRAEASRLIRLHILPALGTLPVAVVGPAQISALLFKMRQTTPIQANRTRAVLRTMFGRAEEWEYRPLGSNPVAVVKQRAPETKRERRLQDLELKALGTVLQTSKEAPTLLLAVRLALLAGMRKGEIQTLRWTWIDLEAGEIRIPPDSHKTGKKTGKTRVVHLCSALVAELKSTLPTLGCPYVVPGKPKKDPDGKIAQWDPIIGLQGPWERIREAAGLSIDGDPREEDPGWHDLRRTFGSVGADLGLKAFVGELLGHAEQSVTDIYTRSAAAPLHQAAETIGARIEGILSGAIDPVKEAEERRKARDGKNQCVS